jgi:hypothetical protein
MRSLTLGNLEIVNSQEEADPTGELSAHDLLLLVAIGARKQNARHTACRANHDPTLGATIIRQRRNVLD